MNGASAALPSVPMEFRGGFRDECGIFGIADSEDAGNIAYLGLYALQHRGQESAGIATLDGDVVRIEREMGYVADVFDEVRLSRLPGRTAIGHVRYSTSGASLLANAQPIVFATGRGPLALAHNGNLVNAREIRRELEASGALFTTTSDSEVILHLVARSRAPDLPSALAEALLEVRGAYSILVLAREDQRRIAGQQLLQPEDQHRHQHQRREDAPEPAQQELPHQFIFRPCTRTIPSGTVRSPVSFALCAHSQLRWKRYTIGRSFDTCCATFS